MSIDSRASRSLRWQYKESAVYAMLKRPWDLARFFVAGDRLV